jgi:hypothetical protein
VNHLPQRTNSSLLSSGEKQTAITVKSLSSHHWQKQSAALELKKIEIEKTKKDIEATKKDLANKNHGMAKRLSSVSSSLRCCMFWNTSIDNDI